MLTAPSPLLQRYANTGVSTRYRLSVENERADAGRDGQTRLSRETNSQVRTIREKISFSLFS